MDFSHKVFCTFLHGYIFVNVFQLNFTCTTVRLVSTSGSYFHDTILLLYFELKGRPIYIKLYANTRNLTLHLFFYLLFLSQGKLLLRQADFINSVFCILFCYIHLLYKIHLEHLKIFSKDISTNIHFHYYTHLNKSVKRRRERERERGIIY